MSQRNAVLEAEVKGLQGAMTGAAERHDLPTRFEILPADAGSTVRVRDRHTGRVARVGLHAYGALRMALADLFGGTPDAGADPEQATLAHQMYTLARDLSEDLNHGRIYPRAANMLALPLLIADVRAGFEFGSAVADAEAEEVGDLEDASITPQRAAFAVYESLLLILRYAAESGMDRVERAGFAEVLEREVQQMKAAYRFG